MNEKKRCKWCNLRNDLYVQYHDTEWCVPNFDDQYLYEMLILESFQAGLSWECVLNKRENFRRAYDDFDLCKVIAYDEDKKTHCLATKASSETGERSRPASATAGSSGTSPGNTDPSTTI